MPTINRPLSGFICLVGLIAASGLYSGCSPHPTVVKLQMPGTFRVRLKPSDYVVWAYTIWPSKNIHEPDSQPVNVQIDDENGAHVQVDPIDFGRTVDMQKDFGFRHSPNVGRPRFSFQVAHGGQFKISSISRCVLVLIPPSAIHMDSDQRRIYEGMEDDTTFERPESRALP